MKKLKYILFASLVLVSFTSCKHSNNNDDTSGGSTTTTYTKVDKPTSLTTLSDLNNVILYSLDNTYLVTVNTSVSDSNVVVYQYSNTVNIEDTNTKKGNSITTKKQLDDTFTLVTKDTKVEQFDTLDINKLFTCTLNESYLSNVSVTESKVTYSVKKDSSTNYFNDTNAVSDTDVSVTILVNDYKITSIAYSYSVDSKAISSTTTYSYLV